MKETHEPVITELGKIYGRDAIFLDEIHFDYQSHQLELRGEFNSSLCSGNSEFGSSYIGYSILFKRIIAVSISELDLARDYGASSFDRVVNSRWIDKMRRKDHSGKVGPTVDHFVLFTYDDVFDIVCESFELKLLEERQKG